MRLPLTLASVDTSLISETTAVTLVVPALVKFAVLAVTLEEFSVTVTVASLVVSVSLLVLFDELTEILTVGSTVYSEVMALVPADAAVVDFATLVDALDV